jgi:UDP-N-acetylmuramoyl-tripeptide--D-alanyl-D-alanine ligase
MNLETMMRAMHARHAQGRFDPKAEPAGVSIDTRTLRPGEMFVALRGPRFDGHDFVVVAQRMGACAAVVASDSLRMLSRPGGPTPEMPLLAVEDTQKALGLLGKAFREAWPCRALGVTGSVGKTTTKELTRLALEGNFRVFTAPGNLNNLYGLPLALTRRRPEENALVCEMGISTPGEMAALAEIYTPDLMIFTRVAPAHLEGLGSVEGVFMEKTSILARMSPREGVAVANADDEWLRRTPERFSGRVVFYGFSEGAHVRGMNLESKGIEGSRFEACAADGQKSEVHLPLPGRAQASNALAALAAAWALGVPLAEAAKRLAGAEAPPGRGRVLRLMSGKVCLVDDTYNASPEAYLAAMEALRDTPIAFGQRRILVAGDMLELGEQETALHHKVARMALQRGGVEIFLGVGPRMRGALRSAHGSDMHEMGFTDAPEAAAWLAENLRDGDVVWVKGSRGMRMERVVEHLVEKSSGTDGGGT